MLDLDTLHRMPTAAQTEPPGAFPDDPESLPPGSVVEGSTVHGTEAQAFDFVVVGSGAAGGVAAHELAEAGFRVALVEEGPWVRTRQFQEAVQPAFKAMYRNGGGFVIQGRTFIPLLQGVCVGGGTTVNSAIAWRLPDDVYADWAVRFGVGSVLNERNLAPCFDDLERLLEVHPVEEHILGRNNTLMRDGMLKLGIRPHVIDRYARGCRGSARCAQGCPNGAKLSTALTFVPWALAKGATLFTEAKVQRVTHAAGKATGVVASTSGKGTLRLSARRGVVVAASTVQTPTLLRRSGLRSKAIGEHFMAHPGVGLGALSDDVVDLTKGVTQAMETIQFRRTHRFKLESLALSPELAAVRIPGFGASLIRRLADFRRLAVWGVQVRAYATGKVDMLAGADRVRYSLGPEDVRIAKKGLRTLAEIAFASGAREVMTGIHGLPETISSPDQLALIDAAPDDPRYYMFIATHLFGAARMGPDSRSSAVGLDFATHEIDKLFVVDSSVFPSNIGVNPQHTIMAVAMHAARTIAARC